MKKLITVLALVASTVSMAEEEEMTNAEICTKLQKVGEDIMWIRQENKAISEVIAASQGNKIIESMVISAYDTPLFNGEDWKKRAVKKFGNQIGLECFKKMNQ